MVAGPTDAATDASAAIQSAINGVSAAGGGVVHLGEGTFLVDSRIELKSNVSIRGVGPQTVLKAGPNCTTAVLVGLGATAVSNVTLADFRIDGNSAATAPTFNGIQVSSGAWIDFVRLFLDDVADNGVYLIGTTDATMRQCRITGSGATGANGHGVQAVLSSHRLTVDRHFSTACGGMGVRVDNSDEPAVIHGRFDQAGGGGFECIGVTDTCPGATIHGNHAINGQDNGISASAPESSVVGNYVVGAQLHGIQVNGANCTVVGNVSKNNNQAGGATRAGIHINNVENTIVTGNRCWDDQSTQTQDYGLKITGEVAYTETGNDFSGNKTSATGTI